MSSINKNDNNEIKQREIEVERKLKKARNKRYEVKQQQLFEQGNPDVVERIKSQKARKSQGQKERRLAAQKLFNSLQDIKNRTSDQEEKFQELVKKKKQHAECQKRSLEKRKKEKATKEKAFHQKKKLNSRGKKKTKSGNSLSIRKLPKSNSPRIIRYNTHSNRNKRRNGRYGSSIFERNDEIFISDKDVGFDYDDNSDGDQFGISDDNKFFGGDDDNGNDNYFSIDLDDNYDDDSTTTKDNKNLEMDGILFNPNETPETKKRCKVANEAFCKKRKIMKKMKSSSISSPNTSVTTPFNTHTEMATESSISLSNTHTKNAATSSDTKLAIASCISQSNITSYTKKVSSISQSYTASSPKKVSAASSISQSKLHTKTVTASNISQSNIHTKNVAKSSASSTPRMKTRSMSHVSSSRQNLQTPQSSSSIEEKTKIYFPIPPPPIPVFSLLNSDDSVEEQQNCSNMVFQVHFNRCSCRRLIKYHQKVYFDRRQSTGLIAVPRFANLTKQSRPHCSLFNPDGKKTISLKFEKEFFNIFNFMYPGAKISNAKCRLTPTILTRNGFVVISSKKPSSLNKLIKKATKAKKEISKLHHDHCDTLDFFQVFDPLWRKENKFGSHLSQLFENDCKKECNKYVLVMKTANLDGVTTYDLPGGKRKLGESTIDCAIRETKEETSLILTKKNFEVKKRYLNEVNCFYFIDAKRIC